MKNNDKNYVSNKAGNNVDLDIKVVISDTLRNIFRRKRELSDVIDAPPVKKRTRIVKKLIRVQPRNITENGSGTEASEINVSISKPRRRFRVKKKKRLLKDSPNTEHEDNLKQLNSSNIESDYLKHFNTSVIESEDHLQQGTKPRRKIVITRKRLLPRRDKSLDISTNTMAIESSTTTVVVETTSIHLNKEILTMHHEDSRDVTEENLIENDPDDDSTEENTTEYDVDSNESEENEGTENTNQTVSPVESPKNGLNFEIDNENDDNDYKSEESKLDELEDVTEENQIKNEDDSDENTDAPTFQSIPEYEPFFPELTESLDAPVILFKTTVLSSIELVTKTIVQSRLRTYTFIVTRVHGTEQIVTSTTEVKPQIATSILTEPLTKYTTLTLLNFDATQTLTELQKTTIPTLDNSPPQLLNQGESAFV